MTTIEFFQGGASNQPGYAIVDVDGDERAEILGPAHFIYYVRD